MFEIFTATRVLDVGQLEGWLPVDAVIQNGRPGLLWLDMRGATLDEPFFADSVERRRAELPPNSELFTDFDALLQFEKNYKLKQPKGLIFHSSRCGSTAIANTFKALGDTIVFSEPYVVDKLVGRLFTDARENRTKEVLYSVLIRAAVGVLGQHGGDSHYYVKFSAASSLQLHRLRKIWEGVPWLFVYRDPLEIMVSNLSDPPVWMSFQDDTSMAAALVDLNEAALQAMSREEFCARVLGRIFEVAAQNVTETARLLNYRDLTPKSVIDLLEFFDVANGGTRLPAIKNALALYAKDRAAQRTFVPDSEAKQKTATTEMRTASEKWAMEAYERLEELRIKQASERCQQ